MILDNNWSCNKLFLIGLVEKCSVTINKIEVIPSFWVNSSDDFLLKGQLTRDLVRSIGVTCRSKIAKIILLGNPRLPPWRPSWKSIFASSPKPKGQLTWNLVGSMGVTCRSKLAKIVPIWNPRWPPWWPSWKSIFCFFSWTKRPVDSKLGRKHLGAL